MTLTLSSPTLPTWRTSAEVFLTAVIIYHLLKDLKDFELLHGPQCYDDTVLEKYGVFFAIFVLIIERFLLVFIALHLMCVFLFKRNYCEVWNDVD